MTGNGDSGGLRLLAIVRECETHARRLSTARDRCAANFPIDGERYENLDDDAVANVDHMVYRFMKLQDALGAKLYPALGLVLRDDAERVPFYDILSTLERARVVSDADRWNESRLLRNQLAHDYDNRPEEGAVYLNRLFDAVDELVTSAATAAAYAREHAVPQ